MQSEMDGSIIHGEEREHPGLRLRMGSAATSGSSAMPPVSAPWNQRWNAERRSQARATCHHRSSASAWGLRTPTICGSISTRPSALLHRDAADCDLPIVPMAWLVPGAQRTQRQWCVGWRRGGDAYAYPAEHAVAADLRAAKRSASRLQPPHWARRSNLARIRHQRPCAD
jgi:hypothetical protein